MAAEQQLQQARQLCNEQKYEQAVALMSSMVERIVKYTGTELDARNAKYFYEYGSIMLQQVVSRSELLGEATKRAHDETAAAAAASNMAGAF